MILFENEELSHRSWRSQSDDLTSEFYWTESYRQKKEENKNKNKISACFLTSSKRAVFINMKERPKSKALANSCLRKLDCVRINRAFFSSVGYNMIWRVLRNMDSVLNSLINVRTGKGIHKSGRERLMYFLFACKYIFNCASVSQLLQCQRPGTEKSTNRVRILIEVTDACLALTNWRKAWIQFFTRTATSSVKRSYVARINDDIYVINIFRNPRWKITNLVWIPIFFLSQNRYSIHLTISDLAEFFYEFRIVFNSLFFFIILDTS